MKKQWHIQKFSALRALVCYEFLKKLHEKSMIFPKMKTENPIMIPIEINESNETQMKPKWTSIENNWNWIENQMKVQSKVQLKLNWNSIETQLKIKWNSIEIPVRINWKSSENQLKINWQSIETQMKLKWKSIEIDE